MTDEFTFDLDHLDEIVAQLSALAGFVGDHLDEIDRKAKTLTGSDWDSAAATAYLQAHSDWIAGAREFVDGVRDMSDAAAAAHGRYTRAISFNLKMLTSGQ
ncbi:WXG100 family type VII secretion target [Nocardia sp. NPDC046473]|uniref:WXG100 family type VII secretion target n=1 Tax=Nocardia sp. NPDC046473 TaxID=3155733 RepID=UPI0033F26BFF